jgi:hypothetical protein
LKITIHNLDAWVQKLQQVGKGVEDLSTPLFLALSVVRSYLKQYPLPPAPGFGFVSDKQRRAFFGLLKSGRITVPYRRTMLLGRSWHITVKPLKGTLANPIGLSYGRWVQDEARQAKIHKGRWRTVQDATVRCKKLVVAVFEHYVSELLK